MKKKILQFFKNNFFAQLPQVTDSGDKTQYLEVKNSWNQKLSRFMPHAAKQGFKQVFFQSHVRTVSKSRSSCSQMFLKIDVKTCSFFKKLQQRYFPVKFVKSIRMFFKRTPPVAASENYHPSFFFKKRYKLCVIRADELETLFISRTKTNSKKFFPRSGSFFYIAKAATEGVLYKKVFNFRKIHRKTPVPQSFFNKDVHFPKFVRLFLIQNQFHSLY